MRYYIEEEEKVVKDVEAYIDDRETIKAFKEMVKEYFNKRDEKWEIVDVKIINIQVIASVKQRNKDDGWEREFQGFVPVEVKQ